MIPQQDVFKRQLYIGFAILILLIGGIFYYTKISLDSINTSLLTNFNIMQDRLNYNLTKMQDQMTGQIDTLNKSIIVFRLTINDNILDLEKQLRNESEITASNLSKKIFLVENSIGTSQKESEQRLDQLSAQLAESESSYNNKINNLKNELGNHSISIINMSVSSQDFSDVIERVLPSVVSIITERSQASGVFVSSNQIITNYHVVNDASNITVLAYDGELYPANIKFFNSTLDLALLEVNTQKKFSALPFEDLSNVRLGSKVIALGNPFGLAFSVTEGIISGLNRVGPNGMGIYIQTDVKTNPGNSGGPLVNVNGKLVGITTFKISNGEGLGFAIDSDYIKSFIDTNK